MKKGLAFALVVFVMLAGPAMAIKGIGIKYGVEYAKFPPGEGCLEYKVYNPWDEDVMVELSSGGDLEDLFSSTGTVKVPAGTASSEALPIQICFNLPYLKKAECEGKKYNGEVVAQEATVVVGKGAGSSTAVVAAAPLTIEMICDDVLSGAPVLSMGNSNISFMRILSVLGVLASLIVLGFAGSMYRKSPSRKRKKYMDMYHEATQLQQDLTMDPFNQSKRYRFNELSGKMQKLHGEI